jgi:tetratricopeptide (TPR) repeat protein
MGNSAPDGLGTFLTNIFGDRYLHAVNHSTFNRLGSVELYNQQFGEDLAKKNSLFIFLGSDSGLLLNYLSNIEFANGSRALVVDFPEVINRISEVVNIAELPNLVKLAEISDWDEALTSVDIDDYIYLDNIYLFESFAAQEGHLPEYKEVFWDVKQRLETRIWRLKAELGTELFLARQLELLTENRHPVSCLRDVFNDRTAILLGGGPSLDSVLPWIKEHREDLVIIAVSRISKRLLEFGLVPHIVFTADPGEPSFSVSKEICKLDSSVLLVNAYHAYSPLIWQWGNRNLYLGKRFPWKTKLNVDNDEIYGPTVTNCALNVAVRMGFSRILLAGFDLCFSKEGFTHAQGSLEANYGPAVNEIFPTVTTYSGYQANTTQAYLSALEDLSFQTKFAKERCCQLINLSSDAAEVDGIRHTPIEQIVFPQPEGLETTEDLINKAYPPDSVEERVSDCQAVLNEVRKILVRLKKVENLALEALECNDGLFGRKGKKADFKYKIKMDQIEKTLNREYEDIIPLVKKYALGCFLKTTRPDENAEWTNQEIEDTGRNYYFVYSESARTLRQDLQESEERILCRLEELKSSPDFSKLFNQWSNDRTPGRAKIWLQTHKDSVLSEADKTHLNEAVEVFDRILERYEGREPEEHLDPAEIKSKAQLLFRRNALDELKSLDNNLSYYKELESGQQLKLLVEAYIAESEDRPSDAFNCYQAIVDANSDDLLEEALQRIAYLAIEHNDQENALLALECLSALALVYQPNYAEMLKLVGRYADAAEVYGDYLTKAPDDLLTMLKLAQLYLDMNATEAAEMALKFVLEKDPENATAKVLLKNLEKTDAE